MHYKLCCLLMSCLLTAPLPAQSLLERTPNLTGGWTGASGIVHFNFLHRFNSSAPPARQVGNSPTFLLGYSLDSNSLLGVHYATRSDVASSLYPNEWEFFTRRALWHEDAGRPVDVAVQAGYNLAAESVDGELAVALDVGALKLLGTGRVFSDGYGTGVVRWAIGAGAIMRLTTWLALAGDAVRLIDATDAEELGWSAALQLGIPYTPHTLSLHVANTNTATLQGSSRGRAEHRFGFEFTVPLTPARYFGRRPAATAAPPHPGAHVQHAQLRALRFVPDRLEVAAGTIVVWKNDDQLAHTITAHDGSWTSPLLQPGESYQRLFSVPGAVPIVCTPHPFMKMVVEVKP